MLTRQEMFDRIWQRFVVERAPRSIAPSNRVKGNCQYRRDHTPTCPERCFMGVFIPDDLYWPSFEGFAPDSTPTYPDGLQNHIRLLSALNAGGVPVETFDDRKFATSLQAVHDDDDSWLPDGTIDPDALRNFALAHGLTAPPLEPADATTDRP